MSEPYVLTPAEEALRRARLRRHATGRRHSEETKRKISEARMRQEAAKRRCTAVYAEVNGVYVREVCE
jgi:hypothetical protein